jgi:hypothetical protein
MRGLHGEKRAGLRRKIFLKRQSTIATAAAGEHRALAQAQQAMSGYRKNSLAAGSPLKRYSL